MNRRIDINVDIGEGFPHDEDLLTFASSANICCGEHAGSWELTEKTIKLCQDKNVRIGAHPGFADREGAGRRYPPAQITRDPTLIGQVDRFFDAARPAYVKPHGAWYNLLAGAIPGAPDFRCELRTIVREYDIPAMLMPCSPVIDGLDGRVIREGFADRRYRADGTLVPRGESGAMLEDESEIASQVLQLACEVESICIHGDNPDCLRVARFVFRVLTENGFAVGS